MNDKIVISGPQGCGKSKNAEFFKSKFGKKHVIDDWHPRLKLRSNAVHLTNVSLAEVEKELTRKEDVSIFTFEQAIN